LILVNSSKSRLLLNLLFIRQTTKQVLALTPNKENSPLLKLSTVKSFFFIYSFRACGPHPKASTLKKQVANFFK
jgi:hypothetical protein